MTAARKGLCTVFCKLLAPMVQRAVGDSQVACNLGLRFVAGSQELDRFLLKFSCKGSLRFLLLGPFAESQVLLWAFGYYGRSVTMKLSLFR